MIGPLYPAQSPAFPDAFCFVRWLAWRQRKILSGPGRLRRAFPGAASLCAKSKWASGNPTKGEQAEVARVGAIPQCTFFNGPGA